MTGVDEQPGRRPRRWLATERADPDDRSPALEVAARLLFRSVLVFSVYLLLVGHSSMGGGFVAGLVAGAAFVLRYVAGGPAELRAAVPVDPGVLLGAGLLLILATGAGAWVLGAPFASSAVLETTVPVLGTVKLVTSLGIDIGLYLLVAGVVLDMVRLLGVEAAPEAEVPEGRTVQ